MLVMSPTQKAEIGDLQRQTVTHLQKPKLTRKDNLKYRNAFIIYLVVTNYLRRSNLRFALAHGLREFSEYIRVKKAWQLMALQRHRVWSLLAHILVEQEAQKTYAIRKRWAIYAKDMDLLAYFL